MWLNESKNVSVHVPDKSKNVIPAESEVNFLNFAPNIHQGTQVFNCIISPSFGNFTD